ncbi:MAG: cation transporter, partial [Bacteroidota bacterium]|nr:cation transporter [Bacteroidota bacterium]
PHLNEGALWITCQLPMSSSIDNSTQFANEARRILLTFPEVRGVLTQTGRPDDGTDAAGFFNVQCDVDLLPQEDWPHKWSRDQLIDSMNAKLSKFPGIIFNYSQPILDNVEEAASGVKGSLAVKIYGRDLQQLDSMAKIVHDQLAKVDGVDDLGILKNIGQPEFRIELDQQKIALYGVNPSDVHAIIEMAIGGKAATQLFEEEKKFDVRIRYQPQFRQTEEQIGNLLVPAKDGSKIPIKEIARIRTITGPAYVYRENSQRYIAIKFSIRGRDLGGAIAEAQQRVNAVLKAPKGYKLTWNGEFENQVRATKRLGQVVPLSLLAIFIILFVIFSTIKDAFLVILNVPFAIIGGILALHITGVNFSISAGIGFIALFGICIQNGVILITEFKHNLSLKLSLQVAIKKGIESRVRPVVMTALMAALGLLPAAISTGIGSETQKPLAIVVIGGLITSTILTLLILPLIFEFAYKWHRVKNPH